MNACPDGWHLASDEEWSTLIKYLDPRADPNADLSRKRHCRGYDESNGNDRRRNRVMEKT